MYLRPASMSSISSSIAFERSDLLRQQHVELLPARRAVGVVHIGALRLAGACGKS